MPNPPVPKGFIPDAPPKGFIPDAPPKGFIPDSQQGETPPIDKPPVAPNATIGPTPPRGPGEYFKDVGLDLRSGGNRTIVGKGLGYLQGQGDKGYSGLESGVSPAQADYMGSMPLGLAKIGQGTGEIAEGHPVVGAGHLISGAAQTATIPLSFAVGPEGGAEGALNKLLPSKRIAGQNLATIAREASDVPVGMSETQPALGTFRQTVKTGGLPSSTATKLSNRIMPAAPKLNMLARNKAELSGVPMETTVPEPINFPEARKFYTNISRETAKPGMLKSMIENPKRPNLRMDLGNVREALNTDLTNAAGTIGRGEDYANNMREYARGARLNNVLKKAAIGGGMALTAEGLKHLGVLGKIAGGVTQ